MLVLGRCATALSVGVARGAQNAEREHEAETIVASYSAAEARYLELQEQNAMLQQQLEAAGGELAAARDEAEQAQEQVGCARRLAETAMIKHTLQGGRDLQLDLGNAR